MLGIIIAISVELILGALLINRIILYQKSKQLLKQETKRTALYEEYLN